MIYLVSLLLINDTCMGQGNTNASRFVVQRTNLIAVRTCFFSGDLRRPVIYASDHFVGAENCLLTRINPDCRTPAVVSLFD